VVDIGPGNQRADIVADLARADAVPEGGFECFILTQTLQYVTDVRAALRHARRMLRPGGVLLAIEFHGNLAAAVAFLCGLSCEDVGCARLRRFDRSSPSFSPCGPFGTPERRPLQERPPPWRQDRHPVTARGQRGNARRCGDSCRRRSRLAVLDSGRPLGGTQPRGGPFENLQLGVTLFFTLSGFLLHRPSSAARSAARSPAISAVRPASEIVRTCSRKPAGVTVNGADRR
jgi:Methyltransferase domain